MNTVILEPRRYDRGRHFEKMTWLLKARSFDDMRPNLQCLYVESGFYCCCDGHRLHYYAPDQDTVRELLDDGLYEIKSATKKQIILAKTEKDLSYPDIARVLAYRPVNGIPSVHIRDTQKARSYFIYHVFTQVKKGFNLDYLLEGMMQGEVKFESTGEGFMSALVFGNEEQIAVIMPVKFDD